MKIHCITWTWNEEFILPYFLKHYSFCDLITLYDDHSSDRTLEIAKQFPNVEVIPRDKKDKPELDEMEMAEIYNNAYKSDRSYDWVIVTCPDEFLYHPNLLEKLEEYQKLGVTVPRTVGFDMWTDKTPTEDKPLHELITLGRYSPNHSKCIVFNPKIDINFGIGMHTCNPTGPVKWSDGLELKVLHFLYSGFKYFTERRRFYWEQTSQKNKDNNWGFHNKIMGEMSEKEYNELGKTMGKIL
jgi:hypothetical protein